MLVHHVRLPLAQMLTWGLLPSCFKIALYKLKGARIGQGVKMGWGSVIIGAESIEIGDHSSIGMFTAIVCTRLEFGQRSVIRPLVLIQAEQVIIGNDVIISETALIRTAHPSRKSRIVIGDRAHIFSFSLIDPSREVEIGTESSVGFGTYIFTHGAYKSKLDGYPVTFGKVHIGKRVWIPSRVFIMPSVTIGDDAVIGTGALVNQDIPPGALAVGLPAKVIRSKEEFAATYSNEEKSQIVDGILTEFHQYLQDYGFDVIEGPSLQEWRNWKIRKREGRGRITWQLYASLDKSPRELPMTPDHATFLSLWALEGAIRQDIESHGAAWFDLETRKRSLASNDLGDELADFIDRYGICCARV